VIHVCLDTSILDQDPQRKKAAFQALTKLASSGHVKVHLPFVVEKEFLSHREDSYSKPLSEISSALHSLERLPLSDQLRTWITERKLDVIKITDDLLTYTAEDFEEWCQHIEAERIAISPHHGQNVASSYFSGKPPFASKKKKEDFPDAFIFETVVDLTKDGKHLHVVCADERLRSACSSLSNVAIHKSLDDFIKIDECRTLLRHQAFEAEVAPILAKLSTTSPVATQKLQQLLDSDLGGRNFIDKAIPSDGHEAMIEGIADDPEDIWLKSESAEYLGGGTLIVPFSCRIDCLVHFYIFKGDYYTLPEDRMQSTSVSEYDNDHYFSAEETMELSIEGTLSITFDLESIQDNESVLDNLETKLDEADWELESIYDVKVIGSELI
jgi:hypothetical protein